MCSYLSLANIFVALQLFCIVRYNLDNILRPHYEGVGNELGILYLTLTINNPKIHWPLSAQCNHIDQWPIFHFFLFVQNDGNPYFFPWFADGMQWIFNIFSFFTDKAVLTFLYTGLVYPLEALSTTFTISLQYGDLTTLKRTPHVNKMPIFWFAMSLFQFWNVLSYGPIPLVLLWLRGKSSTFAAMGDDKTGRDVVMALTNRETGGLLPLDLFFAKGCFDFRVDATSTSCILMYARVFACGNPFPYNPLQFLIPWLAYPHK